MTSVETRGVEEAEPGAPVLADGPARASQPSPSSQPPQHSQSSQYSEAAEPPVAPPTTGPSGDSASGPAAASIPKQGRPRFAVRRPEALGRAGLTRHVAVSVSLAAVLVLGFAAYLFGLSQLQEQHSQAGLYRHLSGQLATATAPVGPTTDGDPVAVLDIPAIGLRQAVVVQGTSGVDLARGPGHLVDSVLPGQAGVSVLFGRRAAFGGPFAHLPALRVGDKISVTTGQGTFSYTVNTYGTPARPIRDFAPARLVLVTGDSTLLSSHAVYVGARLDGTPAAASAPARVRPAQDAPLATDADAMQTAQLWALLFLAAAVAAAVLARLWHRRAAYLTMAPVLVALAWCVYENVAVFLPNLT